MVKKWVDFYKANRQVLDGDVIHVRRADGRDYDAMLHVDPTGTVKGMLSVYNPLNESIKRKIPVNLYYTGLKDKARISQNEKAWSEIKIEHDGSAWIELEIPAHSQTFVKIQ